MKLLHLEFFGIGPFGGHEVIDFTSLTADGLFLLEGPTGSGKSTIIDAVVFALYGKVAGAEASEERVRSSHAEPRTESYVDLVFEVASGIYRVRRTPKWSRPKTRGTGFTPVNASAQLWRMSQAAVDAGEWRTGVALAAKAREVGQELGAILGLTREQFVQTVVLPQGQFADFLRLKSTDRSALLESLFGTEDYRKLAEKLAADSRQARKVVDAARNAFTTAVETWLGNEGVKNSAAQVRTLLEQTVDESDSTVLDFMGETSQSLSEASEEARTIASERAQEETKARADLNSELALEAAVKKRATLLAAKAALEEQRDEITALRQKITLHRRAVVPVNRLDDVTRATTAASAALEAATGAWAHAPEQHSALLAHSSEPLTASSDLGMLAACAQETAVAGATAVEELDQRIGAANEIANLEASIPELVSSQNAAKNELTEVATSLEHHRAELEALPPQKERLLTERTEAEKLASGIQSAEAAIKALTTVEKVVAEAQALQSLVSASESSAEKALGALTKARAEEKEIFNAWIASSAAELALHLESDSPCPVCGSTSHPQPAPESGILATRKDVDKAIAKSAKALEKSDTANRELLQARTSLKELNKQLGDHTAQSIAASLESQRAALAEAKAAAKRITELDKKINEATVKADALHTQISTLQATSALLSERDRSIGEQIEATQTKVAAALENSGTQSASGLVKTLRSDRQQAENGRAGSESLLTAIHTLVEAQKLSRQALDESKLCEAEARAAFLMPAMLTQIEEKVKAFENDETTISTQLNSEELVQLTGEEVPHVDAVQARFEQAHASAMEANEFAIQAKRSATDAHTHLAHAKRAHVAWAQQADEAGPIVRLAHLANADNESSLIKIPLGAWVLLQRFEVVVERANEHLAIFSRGRYELQRVDEGEKGRKLGLGIAVIDHTGSAEGDVQRAPGSLSGGETFYTSLALALALAEVVQEENGGVHIETLMIDEGFGTLSADVRDVVMQTLTQLTDDGRTVGIVSHVEELKSMIPSRIAVRPSERGSTLTQIS
ncbi:SMC family ATPase [Arcanobacterium wilhelmae]|uniref:AAA family ATPase n=1 Tax=Arcanobacterium wilhelmae TaxID=1803177 RepID=UPI00241537CC|nr:SMC family ATPase [Arcanobacterium wilhelmae]WFN89951.1 SMC family ATPase [Arcanobacterium wilhelmae]